MFDTLLLRRLSYDYVSFFYTIHAICHVIFMISCHAPLADIFTRYHAIVFMRFLRLLRHDYAFKTHSAYAIRLPPFILMLQMPLFTLSLLPLMLVDDSHIMPRHCYFSLRATYAHAFTRDYYFHDTR